MNGLKFVQSITLSKLIDLLIYYLFCLILFIVARLVKQNITKHVERL